MKINVASHAKSVVKAFTWRATAGIDTLAIGYFMTGSVGSAVSIAGAELITKSFLFYLHERVWIKAGAEASPSVTH